MRVEIVFEFICILLGTSDARKILPQAQPVPRLQMASIIAGHKAPMATKGAMERGCDATFDLMILQDTTEALQPVLQRLQLDLPKVFQDVRSKHPDSKIGVGFFGDKPADPGDVCYTTAAKLSDNETDAVEALSKKVASGGFDWAENQLGAMMRSVVSPLPGWRREETRVHHLLLTITDSTSHKATHWEKLIKEHKLDKKVEGPSNLLSDDLLLDDEAKGCEETDYPSWEEWGRLLKKHGVKPMFLVADGADYDVMYEEARDAGLPEEYFDSKNNPNESLYKYYDYYGNQVGRIPTKVSHFSLNSPMDLHEKILDLIEGVTKDICNEITGTPLDHIPATEEIPLHNIPATAVMPPTTSIPNIPATPVFPPNTISTHISTPTSPITASTLASTITASPITASPITASPITENPDTTTSDYLPPPRTTTKPVFTLASPPSEECPQCCCNKSPIIIIIDSKDTDSIVKQIREFIS